MVRPTPKDPATRRRMQTQRSRDTGPELAVRRALRELGVSYRVNVTALPGSPDIANRSRGWAILVHGCYWHHHRECPDAFLPKHNREWWRSKFEGNRARDSRKQVALRRAGVRTLVVWECETVRGEALERRLELWLARVATGARAGRRRQQRTMLEPKRPRTQSGAQRGTRR